MKNWNKFRNIQDNISQGKIINTKYLTVIVILSFIIAGGAYKFLFEGSTTTSADGRTVILLNNNEKNLVLTEMRAFLASVQQINQGIAENNMARVAEHARKSGNAVTGSMPSTLVGKLPLAFKKLGHDTHAKFDQLAMDADDQGDHDHALPT